MAGTSTRKRPEETTAKLLPVSFHATFKPERIYLYALLKFVAGGGKGTLQEIGQATGIPMGTSNGKVQPTIFYCMGMGLLRPVPGKHDKGVKVLDLTDFGRKVFMEDGMLTYPVTQWIAHFNMCHPRTGAVAWIRIFAESYPFIGRRFTLGALTDYLQVAFPTSKKPVGPLVGTYSDPASLAACGALKVQDGLPKATGSKKPDVPVTRTVPPLNDETYRGYGAWLLQLMQDFFPGKTQTTLDELQEATKWQHVAGWSAEERSLLFAELERRGMIGIDRHMDPWILSIKMSAKQAWQSIFDEIL